LLNESTFYADQITTDLQGETALDARFLDYTTIVLLCLSCKQQSSSNHWVTVFTVKQHNTVFVELSLERVIVIHWKTVPCDGAVLSRVLHRAERERRWKWYLWTCKQSNIAVQFVVSTQYWNEQLISEH